MRILHVIATVDPAAGGPSEVVRMLVQLRPEGTEAEVVALDDPRDEYLGGIGVPVHALGPVNSTYGYTRKLVPWLEENKKRFDGVVVHGLWQYHGFVTWLAMRGEVPYMVFPHGMLDPYFRRAFPLKHMKKWLYWMAVEYRVLRDAKRVLFTTAAEETLAKQSFRRHTWKGESVPLGTMPTDGNSERQ